MIAAYQGKVTMFERLKQTQKEDVPSTLDNPSDAQFDRLVQRLIDRAADQEPDKTLEIYPPALLIGASASVPSVYWTHDWRLRLPADDPRKLEAAMNPPTDESLTAQFELMVSNTRLALTPRDTQ